jgi:hypothetical protein
MMQLTKEHLDQALKGLATKEDLQKAVAPLATKEDVRREVHEGVEELARITSAGFAHTEARFNEIDDRLDVVATLHSFERKFQKLEEALHIKR